jgi:prepilin-type N-terminal cleavage/methylation domain-containing protein
MSLGATGFAGARPSRGTKRHWHSQWRASRNAIVASGRQAFSLVEIMVVLVVIDVLTALAVPHFQRAVEQSRADIAAANLRAIWAAEQLYWLDQRTYASDLSALQGCGLIDPQIVQAASGYVYSLSAAGSSTFTATAVRTGSTVWSGEFDIDQTGLITGSIASAGQSSITPGFQ